MPPTCLFIALLAQCAPPTPALATGDRLSLEVGTLLVHAPIQVAGQGHPIRNGIVASVFGGALAGVGACQVVDRFDELPQYGCALLGVSVGLPVGLAASIVAGRPEDTTGASAWKAALLGGAMGMVLAVAVNNGDPAVWALPPSAAVFGLGVGLIARGSVR